jgi:hypothetical protein
MDVSVNKGLTISILSIIFKEFEIKNFHLFYY